MSVVVLPGRKGIEEVLRHKPEVIRRILLREGSALSDVLTELLAVRAVEVTTLAREEFDARLSGEHAQGMYAEIDSQPVEEKAIIERLLTENGVLLIGEQIHDPQNLGALIRVAEAAGACGMVLTKDRSAGVTPAVRKAAAGASELLPIHSTKNLQRFLAKLKKEGVWLLGAALDAESQELYQVPHLRPLAIIVGSEGEGLRRLTKDICDVLVSIPMRGKIQSLNVSQAASILLYELTAPERTDSRSKERKGE